MEIIINEIKLSDSDKLVKYISDNMYGKTFHHHYHILYDLRTLLGNTKKIYTEIGTYCGASACLLLQHDFPTEINCIDPLHVLHNQEQILNQNILKFNKHKYDTHIHKKFSTDNTLLNYLNSINFKTDILFIDGDHSKAGVIFDFENYKNFVNPGGYIIFDDYEDFQYSPEVRIAVDEIVLNNDNTTFKIIGTFKKIKNVSDNGDTPIIFYNEYILQRL